MKPSCVSRLRRRIKTIIHYLTHKKEYDSGTRMRGGSFLNMLKKIILLFAIMTACAYAGDDTITFYPSEDMIVWLGIHIYEELQAVKGGVYNSTPTQKAQRIKELEEELKKIQEIMKAQRNGGL